MQFSRLISTVMASAAILLMSPASLRAKDAAEPYAAGEIHRVATAPSAAIRSGGDPDLRILVWYPADPSAKEIELVIGARGRSIFVPGRVAQDAEWGDQGPFPLILLSHGFGGTARQLTWLGSALARAGYVAAAVDHPGTNGRDGVTAEGAYTFWERAGDMKAALDFVLLESDLAARIDRSRIGIAGFSLGGWTAALLAGARADFARLDQFCAGPSRDSICEPQLEFPLDFSQRHNVLESDRMRPLAARETADHRDQRINAAFMIAPALGQAIDPKSFANVTIPVLVLVGSNDSIAIPATNSETIADGIARARLKVLDGVGHYDFLSECSPDGLREYGSTYCRDGDKTSRTETHTRTVEAARHFFDEVLR